MSDSERTEQPTGKKKNDAKKKGQIPRSRDLAVAVSSLAMTIGIGMMGPSLVARLTGRLSEGLIRIGDRPLEAVTAGDLRARVVTDLWFLLAAIGPLLLLGGIVGVFANVAQGGWNVATEALQLRWSNLSPARGLSRLMPKQSGIELVKSLIATSVLSVLAWNIGREVVSDSLQLPWMTPAAGARIGWTAMVRLLWQSGIALLVIGGADYGVQFWRQRSSLKMTKKEVKDEHKMTEGNPLIKSRVRRVQMDMFRRRMLGSVKTATVVVTNPTHYAVALEYRRQMMSAPVVVAKGQNLLAQRIKEIAREHGVPTVENVPLAQALYKGTEVGDVIPGDLFGAVAEVLAYLVRIKQLML